jgi:hypothetical protein
MPTINMPPFGEIEVSEEIMQQYTPEEFRRMLVQDAAQYAEENDIDLDSFSRQFTKEVTSTSRGIQEMATGERTTDARSDFLAEVALEKDPWKAYTGMAVGALLDPVTLPAAFLKVLKLGRIGTSALAGAFGGGAGAVREEYGESRLANAAFGAGAGGILGAGVEVLMRRFGVNSVEELQKVIDEGGIEAERIVEETLAQESEALARMGERGRERAAQEADVQAIRDVADEPEIRAIREELDIEQGAKEADLEAIKQVGRDAEIERINKVADDFRKEQEADVARQIEEMRLEVEKLPTGTQQKAIEASVKETTGKVNSLNKKIDVLTKQIKTVQNNKKINPQATRAIVQPKQQEVKRLQQEVGKLQQQESATYQPLVTRIKDLRKAQAEIKAFDKTGRIPSFVKVNEPTTATAPDTPVQLPQAISQGVADVPLAQRTVEMPEQQVVTSPEPTMSRAEVQDARVQRNLERAQARPSQPVQQAPAAPVPATQAVTPNVPTTPAVSGRVEAPTQPQATGMLQTKDVNPDELPSEVKGTIARGVNKVVKGIDVGLGALSSRIEAISPEIMNALRKFEATVLEKQARYINPTEPFFKAIDRFSPDMKEAMKGHLFNGRFDEAMELMNPAMKADFNRIRVNLKKIHKELRDAGIDIGELPNYFPRRVKDLEGLRTKMEREHKDIFTAAIDEAVAKNKNQPLTVDQQEEVINKVVRQVFRKPEMASTSNAGKRSIEAIPQDVLKFYHDPAMSLTTYYRNMVDKLEKAKFFGRNTTLTAENTIDMDQSIGKVIADYKITQNIDAQQAEDLVRMLGARFMEGEKAPSWAFRAARDTGYMGTIGNMVSAITNLGDLGTSGALHGFGETIQAALRAATGRPIKYDVVKMGIDHSISHELQDSRTTAKALQAIFKLSQFQRIDRLGKNTLINAAMSKNEKLAKTPAGKAKLRAQWGKYFGDETESLINDLEKGNISENTKLLAFHELSNVQPITLSEMPQYYLEHPDGRIMYMLKSFTLKQIDLVRRQVYQKAKQGDVDGAVINLALLAGYLAAANTGTQVIKDFILQRGIDPDKLPEQAMWNVLSVFGMNQYVYDRYISEGNFKGALGSTILPPVPVLDVAYKATKEYGKYKEGEEVNLAKLTRELPLVGPIIYSWYGGGKENYNERLAKED